MREIKFRAWDGENMLKNAYCHTTPEGWIWMANSCKIGVRSITQYIGLKDKNGKEIYEGDILKCCYYDNDIPIDYFSVYSVAYNERYCQFCTGDAHNIQISTFARIEIIGNIYENPELLK